MYVRLICCLQLLLSQVLLFQVIDADDITPKLSKRKFAEVRSYDNYIMQYSSFDSLCVFDYLVPVCCWQVNAKDDVKEEKDLDKVRLGYAVLEY